MPNNKPNINLDDMDFGHTIRGLQKDDCVFERFILRRLLGRGGMGVVWLANDPRLGRDVALKFAPEVVRWDDLAVEELKEETRKGLELAHPNIVKIYDFLLDEEHAAISMEFIDGENLSLMRTRQPNRIFEVRQLTQWTQQLLDAMEYAHRSAKVIHRDLKPANLMIDREGNLRVTDFGIARSISDALDRATMGGASTGTLAYMSPQQAAGKKPHVTDDLYAIGSTLYELLTGKPPFFTGNIAQQLTEETPISMTARRVEFCIANAEPLPEAWENTILACLGKTPEERPGSVQEIRERLGLAGLRSPASGADKPAPVTGPVAVMGAELASQPTAPRPTQAPVPTTMPGPTPAAPVGPNTQSPTMAAATVAKGPPPLLPAPPVPPQNTQAPTQPFLPSAPAPLPRPTEHVTTKATGNNHTILWVVLVMAMFMGLLCVGGIGWWWWHTHPEALAFLHKAPEPSETTQITDNSGPSTTHRPSSGETLTSKQPVSLTSSNANAKTGTPDNGVVGMPADSRVLGEPEKTPSRPPEKHQEPVPFTTIQNAINEAAPGATVTIPAGNYEESLSLKEGVQLVAAGQVVVRFNGESGSALSAKHCQSGSVKGFTFQHSGSEVTDKDRFAVVTLQSSNVTLEDCVIQSGVGDGILVVGGGKPILRRVQSLKNAKNGLVVQAGATATVEECVCRLNGGSGISVFTTGSSVAATGTTCSDNAKSGIVATDGGSVTLTRDNKFIQNLEAGIAAEGEGITLSSSGSECVHNGHGIFVRNGVRARLEQNKVLDSQVVGIYLYMPAAGTEVRDNIVERSVGDGIQITGNAQSSVVVNGNKSSLNGLGGLVFSGNNEPGFKPLVENNEAHDNGKNGMLVADLCGGQFRHNIAKQNLLGGLAEENGAPDAVFEANDFDQGKQ